MHGWLAGWLAEGAVTVRCCLQRRTAAGVEMRLPRGGLPSETPVWMLRCRRSTDADADAARLLTSQANDIQAHIHT